MSGATTFVLIRL